MICRLLGNILLACVVQVHAQEQATTHSRNVQDSVESLVKSLKTLFDWKVKGWTMYRTDLETTVFGKPSHLEISPTNTPDMFE